MIRQRFHIDKLDWRVYVYYYVDCYYTEGILRRLRSIGCTGKILADAERNMRACRMDTGLTYSNYMYRSTVMVIGAASSGREFFNSYIHEQRHLQDDLGNMNGIGLDGEEIAYLSGEIAMRVYDCIKLFVCDCGCCKDKIKDMVYN